MTDGERPSGSDSFEKAKAALDTATAVKPPTAEEAVAAAGGEGTAWDKPAPTGPPGMMKKQYPEWLQPIVRHLKQVIADETPFAEMCLERAVEIFQDVHNRGLVGIDHFADVAGGGGGGGSTRANIMAGAAAFAVEFYKQCTIALNQREVEFKAAWNETMALKKLQDDKKIVTVGPT